jgi:hypothetical protein
MLERGRLADMIKFTEPRTREQKLQAVKDSLSFFTRNFEVMYRLGEEPVDGACPVYRSKLPAAKRIRANHIYICRRKEYIATVKARKGSDHAGSIRVKYCFLCFKWFDGDAAWEEHYRAHLDSTTPNWCGIRIYCHTMISPGFCPWYVRNESLPAAERLKQWTRNCTLMTHVEDDHINTVRSWPTSCICGTEAKDKKSLCYHLSDTYGLWKAEWKRFGVQEPAREDENLSDVASIPSLEDGDERQPHKRRKSAKTGAKFIECCPSDNSESGNLPIPGPILPDRKTPSNRKKSRQKGAATGLTFVKWFPPSISYSPCPPNSQHDSLDIIKELAVSIFLSRSCDPEPDWRSPSVTLVDGEDDNKEAGGQGLEGQALLELSPHGSDLYNDIATGSFVDDALWVDDVGGAGRSTTDPISVFAPIADACSGSFEDLLDPALFCSVSSTSQFLDFDAS